MSQVVHIPMFPLALLPLPGEIVPLHVFEPRYKQLLQDAEINDMQFGIYFSHECNGQKIGSLMKLESIIKRFPGGEADIIVKCEDIFSITRLSRTFTAKLYPGGDVRFWKLQQNVLSAPELNDLFLEYLKLRNINRQKAQFNIYQIANELNLDATDRYKFLIFAEDKRARFLFNRLKFQMHILEREEKSKDNYYLN
ncbi:MAG: LON peptidase substrate-binding domain-containing protein [Chryseolinea sp.]